MAKPDKKTHRITLDLPSSSKDNLDSLQELIGCNTRAEVFRNALNVLDFVSHELVKGNKFVVIDPEGNEREIVFPIMMNRSGSNGE